MEGAQQYKVFFVSGSTDILEAKSAAEARDKAAKHFGRVQRVEIVDANYYDGPEDDEDEEENEGDEKEEEQEGEGEEREQESPCTPEKLRRGRPAGQAGGTA